MTLRRFVFAFVLLGIVGVIAGCRTPGSNATGWDNTEANFTYEAVTYEHYEGVRITGYTGDVEWVEIPETMDGKPVTEIQAKAFEGTDITHLRIPNSIRTLQAESLHISALYKVSFYGEYVGKEAVKLSSEQFYSRIDVPACALDFEPSEPEDYVGVSFDTGCPIASVQDVSKPISIGDDKYYTYNVVVDLTYEKYASLESFSAFAFSFESNDTLKSIELNDRLRWVKDFAYVQFPALESVTVPSDNPFLKSVEGILYNIDMDTLLIYPAKHSAKTFHIGADLTNIFARAFKQAAHLEAFTVSDDNPYYTELNGVLLSHDETELIKYPPQKNQLEYEVPNTVESIGYFAFNDNPHLERITLPASLMMIGRYHDSTRAHEVFANMPALKAIEVAQNNARFMSVDGVLFEAGSLLHYPIGKTDETFTVPSDTHSIAPYAFEANDYLTHIHINKTLERIGWGAFLNATALTTVTFETNAQLDSISHQAFSGATALASIELPSSLRSIGINAFKDTASLESIMIPMSVEGIGLDAFHGASGVIYAEASEKQEGWHEDWNPDDLEVIWEYTNDE